MALFCWRALLGIWLVPAVGMRSERSQLLESVSQADRSNLQAQPLHLPVSSPPGHSATFEVTRQQASCQLKFPDGGMMLLHTLDGGLAGFTVLTKDGQISEFDFGLVMQGNGNFWNVIFTGFTDSRFTYKTIGFHTHPGNELKFTLSVENLSLGAWQTAALFRWIFDRTQESRPEAPRLVMVPSESPDVRDGVLLLEVFHAEPRLKATLIDHDGLAMTYETKELINFNQMPSLGSNHDFYAWFFAVFDVETFPAGRLPCSPCRALVNLLGNLANVETRGGEYAIGSVSFFDWESYGESVKLAAKVRVARYSYINIKYFAKFDFMRSLYPLDDHPRIAQKFRYLSGRLTGHKQEIVIWNEHASKHGASRQGTSSQQVPHTGPSEVPEDFAQGASRQGNSSQQVPHNGASEVPEDSAIPESSPDSATSHGVDQIELPIPPPANAMDRNPRVVPQLQSAYEALGEQARSFWLLGMNPNDPIQYIQASVLRKAWRKATLESHPDKVKDEHAKVVFQEIMDAYEYLLKVPLLVRD